MGRLLFTDASSMSSVVMIKLSAVMAIYLANSVRKQAGIDEFLLNTSCHIVPVTV